MRTNFNLLTCLNEYQKQRYMMATLHDEVLKLVNHIYSHKISFTITSMGDVCVFKECSNSFCINVIFNITILEVQNLAASRQVGLRYHWGTVIHNDNSFDDEAMYHMGRILSLRKKTYP